VRIRFFSEFESEGNSNQQYSVEDLEKYHVGACFSARAIGKFRSMQFAFGLWKMQMEKLPFKESYRDIFRPLACELTADRALRFARSVPGS
jgi:hypothetical protein